MSAKGWVRACPGLYVDPTGRWVVSREERGLYSIRACLGWGPLLDGVTLMPDYGGQWHGEYRTLAEAKWSVDLRNSVGEVPTLDTREQYRLEDNLARKWAQ